MQFSFMLFSGRWVSLREESREPLKLDSEDFGKYAERGLTELKCVCSKEQKGSEAVVKSMLSEQR